MLRLALSSSPVRLRVLVACEFSGVVREAFNRLGHDAWSCDLLPTEIPGRHFRADAREVLTFREWDLVIAHPPCTYLANSGVRWLYGKRGGVAVRDAALVDDFARDHAKDFHLCGTLTAGKEWACSAITLDGSERIRFTMKGYPALWSRVFSRDELTTLGAENVQTVAA